MPVVIKGLHIPTGKKLKKAETPKKKLAIEMRWDDEEEEKRRDEQRLILWLGVFLGTMITRLLAPPITIITLGKEE